MDQIRARTAAMGEARVRALAANPEAAAKQKRIETLETELRALRDELRRSVDATAEVRAQQAAVEALNNRVRQVDLELRGAGPQPVHYSPPRESVPTGVSPMPPAHP